MLRRSARVFASSAVRSPLPPRSLHLSTVNGMRQYSDAKGKAKEQTSDSQSSVVESEETASATDTSSNSSSDDLVKQIKSQLEAKEAEVIDLTGRLRYLQADYQNLQRISQKEKEQTRDFAISRFASDLLDTVDVLAMALRSVPSSYTSLPPSTSSEVASDNSTKEKPPSAVLYELYEGVTLTNKQLLSTLAKNGITQFDPTGTKFDPNLHEALYVASIPGKEPGSVVETQKFGYMIKGRVLRAAQVGVAQEASS